MARAISAEAATLRQSWDPERYGHDARFVSEYGVAQLKGKSLRERAQALIGLAHPKFRDWLTAEAKQLGHA